MENENQVATKKRKSFYKKWWVWFILIIILLGFIGALNDDPSVSTQNSENSQRQIVAEDDAVENNLQKKDPLPTEPEERIRSIITNQYEEFTVTFWDMDKDGLYEVIANSPLGAVKSCFEAKRIVAAIFENIYSDDIASKYISNIQLSLSPQAQAALGATDAKQISDELWEANGPSNTVRALVASGRSEDNNESQLTRTYWNSINGNCPAM